MPSWQVRHASGDAAAFHRRDLPTDQRVATFFATDSPTLVLGSSQRHDSVDVDAADRQGIDIVRRRSGGGGVVLIPGEFVWLDLEIPASDELWSDDIGRATWWVGDLWQSALETWEPLAAVHRGRMVRTRWSADVCFAGTGPGEVTVADAKLVGISQRRTRDAARFQTMVHLVWRPDVVASLVAGGPDAADRPSTADLWSVARALPVSAVEITARLTAALATL